jgi:hypothetical protein
MADLLNIGQMIGMYIKFLFLLTLIACAKKPVYQAGLDNFDSKYSLALGEREHRAFADQIDNVPLLERDKLSFYLDLDQDGIKDYFDFDIDGDGFHNYIDQFPLNDALGGEDLNQNLIPDFIESKNLLSLQLELVKQSIYIVDLEHKADATQLNKLLFEQDLIKVLKGLDVLNFNTINLSKKGDYNREWRVINLYPMAKGNYLETLIHESFHHYAEMNPETLELFQRIYDYEETVNEFGEIILNTQAKSFVSEYAKNNVDENYAESLMFLWTEEKNIPTERFKNTKFKTSQIYQDLIDIKFDFLL